MKGWAARALAREIKEEEIFCECDSVNCLECKWCNRERENGGCDCGCCPPCSTVDENHKEGMSVGYCDCTCGTCGCCTEKNTVYQEPETYEE